MEAQISVLVLRHEPFEHLGHFARRFTDRNIAFTYKDLGDQLTLEGHAGLVIMGGPQSANDVSPDLAAEVDLISTAIQSGIPVLGICLGAQLIAKALGARVYPNTSKEIGWAPVSFTESAVGDPLFSDLPSPTTFFHWHGETFDLPAGAEWLAYSALCRHQAFRHGSRTYGIQFHPEITPEMIVDWCDQPANCGDIDAIEQSALEQALDPHAFDCGPLANRILDGWINLF
jgi:GMP synthase (glutamine-hydrolysing)